MTSARERFFEQFDTTISSHIIEFSKYLSNIKADVIILMARKAVCLVECFETLNLTILTPVITSDRVLDMDLSWLKGKHIALVDDAVISGTSLYKTIKKLNNAKVLHVSVHAFCVSKRWWSKDWVIPDNPYLELQDQETIELCSSIVDAISVVPRPYSVDFPIYTNLSIPYEDLDRIFSLPNWETYDVTSSLQRTYDIFSYSSIPGEPDLSEFDRSLGWTITRHCQLFKVRVYGGLFDGGPKADFCNIVPIVAFDPLPIATLNLMWKAIITSKNIKKIINDVNTISYDEFVNLFISPESRLRLVQYVVAARLGNTWIKTVQNELGILIAIKQDTRNTRYLFPPQTVHIIQQLSDAEVDYFDILDKEPAPIVLNEEIPQTANFIGEDFWTIQARLVEPFLEMYNTKELSARTIAYDLGVKALEDPIYQEALDRLNHGISLRALRLSLNDLNSSNDVAKIVSLFIDLAIDCGIIVPITVTNEKDGIIYRAYRHGEDVEFAHSEARFCLIMLQAFANALKRSNLQHLWVEKLIVLLIRVGVKKNILTKWQGTLGEDGSIGVRYSLKGAVAQINSPSLYEYNPEGAITKVFLDAGYLAYEEDTKLYILGNQIPNAPLKEGAEEEAVKIGTLFGILLSASKYPTPKLSNDELILISTCLRPNDAAAALAASIEIFYRNWKLTELHKSKLSSVDAEYLLNQILANKISFEAIRSGVWKFMAFMNEEPWQIIDRVSKDLSDDPIYRANWQGFWPLFAQDERNVVPELFRLIEQEGTWCIRISILIRTIQAALYHKLYVIHSSRLDRDLSEQYNKEFKVASEQVRYYCSILNTFDSSKLTEKLKIYVTKNLLNSSYHNIDSDSLFASCTSDLRILLSQVPAIFDSVDTRVTSFGRPNDVVKYQHALYIHLNSSQEKQRQCWEIISNIIKTNRAVARKDSNKLGQQIHIDLPPVGHMGFHHGKWVCASDDMGRNTLLHVANQICEALYGLAQVRLILFTNLSENYLIQRAKHTSGFIGRDFWQHAKNVISTINGRSNGSRLLIVTQSGKSKTLREMENFLEQDGNRFNVEGRITKINVTDSTGGDFIIKSLSFSGNNIKAAKYMNQVDIGIITVVTEEIQAVRDALKTFDGYNRRVGEKAKRIFHEGQLPSLGGGHHSVVVTQQLEQGNRSVMAAYQALKQEYSPRLIILLGIAGSVNINMDLCDVAICDQVVYYPKDKITPEGTKRRGESYKSPSWLKPYLNEFFAEHNEPATFETGVLLPSTTFKVRMGPIGSGESVLAYREADAIQWLRAYNEKTLALETEAGGLAQAFYESELDGEDRTQGYLVIRGISDHADKEKNDLWRKQAAENAMRTVIEILKLMPNPPLI